MKSDQETLLKKNPNLTQSNDKKVISHVQREDGEWVLHTLMIEGCDAPFQFKRQKKYKSLTGARVNLSYYPDTHQVAGMDFEIMKVVRIRIA